MKNKHFLTYKYGYIKEKTMIRIILVAMTVVLYLIFSVPVLTMLRLRAKKDPVGVQEKSLSKIQGVLSLIHI